MSAASSSSSSSRRQKPAAAPHLGGGVVSLTELAMELAHVGSLFAEEFYPSADPQAESERLLGGANAHENDNNNAEADEEQKETELIVGGNDDDVERGLSSKGLMGSSAAAPAVSSSRRTPLALELAELRRNGEKRDEEMRRGVDIPPRKGVKPRTEPKVNLCQLLFTFAGPVEYACMAVGTVGAIITGLVFPAFLLIWGEMLDELNTKSDLVEGLYDLGVLFMYLATISAVAGFFQVACWSYAGERQAQMLRAAYVRSIFRMPVGWFDTHNAGELPTRVTESVAKVQDGIGRKFGDSINYVMAILGSLGVAFYLNWELAAVTLVTIPIIAVSTTWLTLVLSNSEKERLEEYAGAGGVATESISCIRTVHALNAHQYMIDRYHEFLQRAQELGERKNISVGFANGALFGVSYISYALTFWYGSLLVADDVKCTSGCTTGGDVLSVFYAIFVAGMSLGALSPLIVSISGASGAAYGVFKQMREHSAIDPTSNEGKVLSSVEGELELKNVTFTYPARAGVVVYRNLSLKIPAGNTIALVGHSGCGKSTIVSLLLRFYDPQAGVVTLDGHNLTELNVKFLRRSIGFVGQEPVLFAGSIRDNIAYAEPDATQEQIETAAKAANVHEFIESLPKGYDTDVGEAGSALSGGQKQRIAIARAVICDPPLLVLDEATSALDSESERIVQESLDRLHAQKRRTTVMIAHRLSTVRNADQIAVLENGNVVEIGNHTSLLQQNGIYADLVRLQMDEASHRPVTDNATAGEEKKEHELQTMQSGQVDQPPKAETHQQADAIVAAEEGRAVGLTGEDGVSDNVSAVSKPGGKQLNKTKKAKGDDDKEEEEEEEEEVSSSEQKEMAKRIWGMLDSRDRVFFALGCVGAALAGAAFPLEGYITAKAQEAFYDTSATDVRRQGANWSLAFLALAVAMTVGNLLLYVGIGIMGERVTTRLRLRSFQRMLRKDLSFFDAEKNNTGALTTMLATDASKVQRVVTEVNTKSLQMLSTVVVGLGIAFSASWEITLLVLATFPLQIFAATIQMETVTGGQYDTEGTDGSSAAAGLISSAFTNIKTVTAFSMQERLGNTYAELTHVVSQERAKRGFYGGLGFGFSQFVMNASFGGVFWAGGLLVDSGDLTFEQLMIASLTTLFAAFGLGQVMSQMGDTKEAFLATRRILYVLDSEDGAAVDSTSEEGVRPDQLSGAISTSDLSFVYPTRSDVVVYDKLNLDVEPGSRVALVGPSGCGKSTLVSLLLRFYDIAPGMISLDGRDIRDLNVRWLRDHIGYVQQEPVLFSGSIRDNIALGRQGKATDEEVEDAARRANVEKFILSCPDGYDTDIGVKSALISGGQKQRIAIARAIVANPPLLLLDEATSALDSTSEKLVQDSLDKLQASEHATTIVIAHRLSTIKGVDKIIVFEQGRIVEQGTHDSLLQLNGMYARLWNKQQGHT